jgi:glycosyltransferase XagB
MGYGGGNGPDPDRSHRHSGGTPASAAVLRLPRAVVHAAEAATELASRRSAFPELDCVRNRLSLGQLAAVERRAIEIGVGADRVLIAAGIIDEETYVAALSKWLGWHFEDLEHYTRASTPATNRELIDAARTGLIPLHDKERLAFIVAPRGVRELLSVAKACPRIRFRLSTAARMDAFISHCAARPLAAQAANDLLLRAPHLSAAPRKTKILRRLVPVTALLAAAALTMPAHTLAVIEALLSAFFLTWVLFRLLVCLTPPKMLEPAPVSDQDLPLYTVIAALYREARSVEKLVAALEVLDYPREKLQIIFALEADDPETLSAFEQLKLRTPFEIRFAPPDGPRTKPKALNAALAFATGTYTVIYDAEDRPEPDQLRRAVQAFETEGKDVACVQARLTIDNTEQSLLTRLFTAEYAAQFDFFLPGLARMGMPLPLGGSSNHFHTGLLRDIGAWDSYNVTEDADLGTRLARFGYRSVVIDSATFEEAPANFTPWIHQRTRWMKGWMRPSTIFECRRNSKQLRVLRRLSSGLVATLSQHALMEIAGREAKLRSVIIQPGVPAIRTCSGGVRVKETGAARPTGRCAWSRRSCPEAFRGDLGRPRASCV